MISRKKKTRSRQYPEESITDEDFANDFALLANAPAHAEILLPNLEQAARGISHSVKANKTECRCFKHEGAIYTSNRQPLKFVDKFTYVGSHIPSTESNIIICIRKKWTYIERLSITWKSNLCDWIKWNFFLAVSVSLLLHSCNTWSLRKSLENNLDGNTTRMMPAVFNKFWSCITQNSSCIATCLPSQKPSS